jgi:tetratricopeptide (TPR) repeat protein
MSVSTSTAPASAAMVPRAHFWIINPRWDLLLFIGTPALILPIIMVAERYFAATQLYMVVAAFGALGHHLPGMMRAYGDRALFRRFKTRFIVAPLFLVSVCVTFAVLDPELYAITLIAYGWGLWHGLMQAHGFLRIYDAKVKSFARLTARLDQWMCLTWFGTGVLFSSSRVHYILEAFYHAGGPEIPVTAIHAARVVWGSLTVLITLAFLANMARQWRAGHAPSPAKLVLLTTTVAFWIYICVAVRHLLVGILMFEIFHDVQYLSIVWLFNRKRAFHDPHSVDRFTRMLFARGKILVGVYVGLCMLYGSLSIFDSQVIGDSTAVFGGILAASALLHFYYDSFIWKVKEKSTRQALGLEGGADVVERRAHVPDWLRPAMTPTQARLTLGQTFPQYDVAQSNLGIALYQEGDLEGAIRANRQALALDPEDEIVLATARNNLGWALVDLAESRLASGRPAAATPLLDEARTLEPVLPELVNAKGAELERVGKLVDAALKYRVAVAMQPDQARFRSNLATAQARLGHWDEALAQARAGLRLLPGDVTLTQLVSRLEQMATEAATP